MDQAYKDIVGFHGHSCPGLAMGYRMTKGVLGFLSGSRARDEEIVAITENDACGVDALQWLSGCTFGKGNLIFKDYGKQVFTLYHRKTGRGARVVFRDQNVPENLRKDRKKLVCWILSAPEEEALSVAEVQIDEPTPARIMNSITCEFCGEKVMETRIEQVNGKAACIPCSHRV